MWLKLDGNKSRIPHRSAVGCPSYFSARVPSGSHGARSSLSRSPFLCGYFCCVLFTLARWCNPSGLSDWGGRCLMRPPLLSFPDSFCTSFYFDFISKWVPPTQRCDTAFLSIGWQCRSRGTSSLASLLLSFFSSSFSFYFFFFFTHAHFPFLSTSSIITPPSVQDTAESWCCQPEPDALSHSHLRHVVGPAPPPCWSMSLHTSPRARGQRWSVEGWWCFTGSKTLLDIVLKRQIHWCISSLCGRCCCWHRRK